ncbi:MAG TPA: sulfite exporter TauE/SafE family protein [Opitutaceae bacterium]|nr:sulfite exporter TauE/SafE family protein [Opitutaceae bacterium]
MTPAQISLLLGTSAGAGVINAVAGGGSFFTFPALIFCGLPSIGANATSTIALWPGTVASVGAYRDDIRRVRRLLPGLLAISVVGGLLGALILVHTPQSTFDRILPWLMLAATGLFACGSRLARWMTSRQPPAEAGEARMGLPGYAAQLLIATYAGYFGGGASMLMLALLSLIGMSDIHAMNGVKTLLSATQNLIALIVFILHGLIAWPAALIMMGGAIAGGYGGARAAKRTDPRRIRAVVIAVGLALSLWFFLRR